MKRVDDLFTLSVTDFIKYSKKKDKYEIKIQYFLHPTGKNIKF